MNAPDWKNRLGKYWSNSSYNDFVLSHEKFRQAYKNYKVTIKHLVVTGRDGIMWARVSAVHSGKTDSDIARGMEATGKPVEWEEAWYFEVINGKQGNKWDLLKDELSIMRHLDIKCIPQD